VALCFERPWSFLEYVGDGGLVEGRDMVDEAAARAGAVEGEVRLGGPARSGLPEDRGDELVPRAALREPQAEGGKAPETGLGRSEEFLFGSGQGLEE